MDWDDARALEINHKDKDKNNNNVTVITTQHIREFLAYSKDNRVGQQRLTFSIRKH